MSTLSTNIYGSSTSKGFGGLVSGLDTDDLVTQMLANTKNKINRQYQAKQKLLYKQEAYRKVSTELLEFSDKYFSYSSGSSTNILSPKFFQSYTYKSSSDYVNVTGDTQNIANFSINNISSIASYATMTSTNIASSQSFSSNDIPNYISSLAGDTMSIEYSGKTYKLTIDSTFGVGDTAVSLQDVADQLNSQIDKIADLNGGTAGDVSDNILTYSVSGDKLTITSTEGKTTKLSAASNDILTNLKMTVGGEAVSTDVVESNSLVRTASDVLSNLSAYMTFEYNGVKKTINLNSTVTDENQLVTYLQSELDKAYGTNADASKKVTVALNAGKIEFTSAGSTNIFGVSNISTELSNFTGIKAGDYNRLNVKVAIGESGLADVLTETTLTNNNQGYAIKINDKMFEFEKTATFNDIISTINNDTDAKVNISYSSTTDTFSIKADETGSHIGIKIEEVGGGNLAEALFGDSLTQQTITDGKDTTMTYTLNGVETSVTRSTANFSIDGINIELNKNAEGLLSTDTPITFNVTNNTDEVVERVKEFVDKYNEIIELLSTETTEKPDRDYTPLTPEQQEDMEDAEITDWTTQAKKGILFGDSNMTSVLRNLKTSMTGKTSVSSLVLADIGIASASMDTSGKLVLDEEKLREKLLENPDEIASLFTETTTDTSTGATSGIAIQIQSVLRKNIGVYGTSGTLVEEAGLDGGLTSDQNNISLRIEEYDDKMEELKEKMEDERERYWNKFSSLEQSLSNLNSQSSWLTGMLG